MSGIGNFIWDLFKGAIEGIVGGVKQLVEWVGDFFGFLGKLLHDLFVPEDDFISNKTKGLQKTMNSKIDTKQFSDTFSSLQNVKSRSMPTPRASILGVNINFDLIGMISEHLPLIHMFVRVVVFAMLIRYNINNVYKLIRGSDINSGGGE